MSVTSMRLLHLLRCSIHSLCTYISIYLAYIYQKKFYSFVMQFSLFLKLDSPHFCINYLVNCVFRFPFSFDPGEMIGVHSCETLRFIGYQSATTTISCAVLHQFLLFIICIGYVLTLGAWSSCS